MRDYISFGKKLIYIILFGGLVWFISFSIFPENQVIKISVGEESPTTFLAPKYIEIIDDIIVANTETYNDSSTMFRNVSSE